MAWTYVRLEGIGDNKVADTNVTAATFDVPVGNVLLVVVGTDNLTTVQGNSNEVSVTDAQGNVYTKIFEYTKTGGSAEDGITLAVFYCIVQIALIEFNLITASFPSVVAKGIIVSELAMDQDAITVDYDIAIGSSTNPSITLSNQLNQELFWFGVIVQQGPTDDVFTDDADYTDTVAFPVGTSGGSPASNITVNSAWRIATQTSDTFNPVLGTAREFIIGLITLKEGGGRTFGPALQVLA